MTDDDIQVIRWVISSAIEEKDLATLHVERLQKLLDSYLALRNSTDFTKYPPPPVE